MTDFNANYTPDPHSTAAEHADRQTASIAALYTDAAAAQLTHMENLVEQGVSLAPSTRMQLGYLQHQREAHQNINGK
jgi:hypothetical protein